jgi:hypothetical protein
VLFGLIRLSFRFLGFLSGLFLFPRRFLRLNRGIAARVLRKRGQGQRRRQQKNA